VSRPLIRMKGIGKSYPLVSSGVSRLRTVSSLLLGSANIPHYAALQGVDLELMRGESLGLIGENGAGKSTLLKIIAGVVKPSDGYLEVNGSIGALLELGSGFHPDYTGRENVFLAAALMGLSRSAITEKLESIIEFADIGDHIDQPIKHYSTGMVVRLGFAVATAMSPDILITDEVLAVGDESFQKKCIRWMENYLAGGGTLLLCSHGMFYIQKLCHKAAWIHQGKLHQFGAAGDVTREYLAYHEEKSALAFKQKRDGQKPSAVSQGVYAMRELWLEDGRHQKISRVAMGRDVLVCGRLHSPDERPPVIGLGVVKADGTPVYGTVSDIDDFKPILLAPKLYGFGFHLKELPLLPGKYFVRTHAMDPEGLRLFDTMECELQVTGQTRELGLCRLPHAWEGACGTATEQHQGK